MWILGIWILFVSEKAFGNDTMCHDINYCSPTGNSPILVPGNATELDNFCSLKAANMRCSLNRAATCGWVIDEELYRKQFETLDKMCKEDSSLRKDNLGCIKTVLKEARERCWGERMSFVKAYEEYLGKKRSELELVEFLALVCLEDTFSVGCYLRATEECGADAYRVSSEIIHSSGFNDRYCYEIDGVDTKMIVLPQLEDLDLKNHQDILIRNLLLSDEKNK